MHHTDQEGQEQVERDTYRSKTDLQMASNLKTHALRASGSEQMSSLPSPSLDRPESESLCVNLCLKTYKKKSGNLEAAQHGVEHEAPALQSQMSMIEGLDQGTFGCPCLLGHSSRGAEALIC